MKQLLRICLTGAFFLLFEGLLSPMLADNGKSDKEILVLNSINFNLPWARNFSWYVHDVLQEQGITARAESLSVPALQDTMEVNADVYKRQLPVTPTIDMNGVKTIVFTRGLGNGGRCTPRLALN